MESWVKDIYFLMTCVEAWKSEDLTIFRGLDRILYTGPKQFNELDLQQCINRMGKK